MSAPMFTKGPWSVAAPSHKATRCRVIDADGYAVAIIDSGSANTKEAKADARLIADAGTTYHETGKTPSELRAERDALALQVETLRAAGDNVANAVEFYAKVKAASANGEDVTSTGAFRDATDWITESAIKFAAAHGAKP